jgi:putative iron-dependent peroxidase
MATAQPGIFSLGTPTHLHLEFDVSAPDRVLAAVARIREAATPIVGVNVVVGVAPGLWAQLVPDQALTDVVGFQPIVGSDGYTMPASQHGLWVWLHGAATGGVFDLGRAAVGALAGCASLAAEQWAFSYGASQDLTGFEDGTENPPVDEAMTVAVIPSGQPCEGGSVALLQRWVHDLDGFGGLEVGEQEAIVGRTLHGSVELDESVQLDSSHVSRVVVEDDDGEELEVFRRSAPFGGMQEHGLMFVAFSADQGRLDRMLRRMAGAEDGVRDRLTEFSTPTAGAWYVVPPVELLPS